MTAAQAVVIDTDASEKQVFFEIGKIKRERRECNVGIDV